MIQQNKANIYPFAVWWQGQESIEDWVKNRGVNVLWWDKSVHGNAQDWEDVHFKVEALRVQGYQVWVIRQPAYLLSTPLSIDFDKKYQSHLYAFDLDDEFEDKISGGNLWSNPQPIIDYVKTRVSQYHAWLPDVPVIANFNGTHTSVDLKNVYEAIIDCGIDIISSDQYPACTQQYLPNGQLLYPDVVQGYLQATKLFKAWYPHKPVWTFIDTCNQGTCPKDGGGWSGDWKFVGSRSLTPDELWQILYYHKQIGGDGIAWFPQANNGAVMDATVPALIPTILSMSQSMQPKPLPPNVLPAPPTPPTPVVPKKAVKTITITVYNDGSFDVK